jgi:mannosyltransferase OCH1-like enzyme
MIPTTVHSIWIQGIDHFRTTNQKRALEYDKWPAMFPGWEFSFWDEQDILVLIRDKFPHLLQNYQQLDTHNAVKSDMARLLILYTYGGLYMDMSYVLHRDIRWILYGDIDFAIVSINVGKLDESLLYPYNNAWIGSAPRCIVLQSMIDAMPTQKLPTKFNALTICKLYGPQFVGVHVQRYENEPWVRVLPTLMLNPQYEYPDKLNAPYVMAHSNSFLSYTNKLERAGMYTIYHIRRYASIYFLAAFITLIVVIVILIVISVCLKKTKKKCIKKSSSR